MERMLGRPLREDEHVHHKESAHDALLDVFNIDPPLGHIRRELRNDAFLIFTEDGHDGEDFLGHD